MELSTGTIVDDISNWSDLLVLDLKTSGFSNNTILMYTRVYKKFSEFLNKNYPTLFLKDIKSLQLKEFVLYMEKETQKSKSTKETYVKALRKLFIFISDNNSDEYTFDHVIRSFKIISEKKTHEKIKSFNPKETDRFRLQRLKNKNYPKPYISHENMAGSITPHPYSSALRAGASANYILINDERRPTEREMLRLQGFPENFKIVVPYGKIKKQCGNSVAVPVIRAVAANMLNAIKGLK